LGNAAESEFDEFLHALSWVGDDTSDENIQKESALSSSESSQAFPSDKQITTYEKLDTKLESASPEKRSLPPPHCSNPEIPSAENPNEDSEDLKSPVEDTWEGYTSHNVQKLCDKGHQFLCTPKILEVIQHPLLVMKRTPFRIHMFNQHLWEFLLQLGNGDISLGQSLLAEHLKEHTTGEFPVPFEFTNTIITAAHVSMSVQIRCITLSRGEELVCSIQAHLRTKPRLYAKFEAFPDLQGGSILESADCKPPASSTNLQQAWTRHSQKRKVDHTRAAWPS